MNTFFLKLDRVAAWTLLIVIIIYIISGFGMTKGIIDPSLARSMHLQWFAVVGFIAFIIHTFWAIHLALMRHRIWNMLTLACLVIIYTITVIGVVYVAVFYQPPAYQAPISAQPVIPEVQAPVIPVMPSVPSSSSSPASATPIVVKPPVPAVPVAPKPPTPVVPTVKTFTLAELAKYNGRNGQPAYVAVSGNVYDLSSVFRGGVHHGIVAGADQTAVFYEQHYIGILSKYQIVGILK